MEWIKTRLGMQSAEDYSKSPADQGFVFTENQALSLGTTGNGRVDLFFKLVRDTPVADTQSLLQKSWMESPLDTMKIIFLTRNCRGGKGEKNQFSICVKWLINNGHIQSVQKNLNNFSHYGSYKDLLYLLGTGLQNEMLQLFANQLKADLQALKEHPQNVSLAAKWAPSEGCHHDKTYNAVSLFSEKLGVNKSQYRKNYIVPLRKHLRIVERDICGQTLENIDYPSVPSLAMAKYKKIFSEKDEDRFSEYLNKVKKGEEKMNVGQLFPHQIVAPFLNRYNAPDCTETLEIQWTEYVRKFRENMIKKHGSLPVGVSVVDVSGSMNGTPMEVAISLGMLLAEVVDIDSPFHNKLITFSSDPNWFDIPHGSLSKKIEAISHMNWNMTTDLQKVFDMILVGAKTMRVSSENMPSTLWIFSDMQFDQACTYNSSTNFEEIELKYREAGYTRPRIVFWNLRGDTVDFPVCSTCPNTALVSGFSPSLMELFLDSGEIDPYGYVRKAIEDEQYDQVVV